MPRFPRMTPDKAEKMLLKYGYKWVRSKGSHRIYMKGEKRFVLPFHKGKILHPKIVSQMMSRLEEESNKNGINQRNQSEPRIC